jgi:hypothetical protein
LAIVLTFASLLSIPKFETWLRKNTKNFRIGTLGDQIRL